MKSPIAADAAQSDANNSLIYTERTVGKESVGSPAADEGYAPFSILLCDADLYVADISRIGKSKEFPSAVGNLAKEYLSKRDVSAILSCVEYLKRNPQSISETSLIVDVKGIKEYTVAFVSFEELFGTVFVEFKLFCDRFSLVKNFKISELLPSGFPIFSEEADIDGEGRLRNARYYMKNSFLQSRFHNMYHSAQFPFSEPAVFNFFELTKRIVAEFSSALDTGTEYVFVAEGRDNFRHAVIDGTNYVNLVSVLMMFCSVVSESGTVEVRLSHSKDRVSVIFSTSASECNISFVGGFAFPFLAKMYPQGASYVYAAEYISRLFGLRCYGELSGENTVSVELLIKSAPPEMEIGCMHVEGKELKSLCSRAVSLAKNLDFEIIKGKEPDENEL